MVDICSAEHQCLASTLVYASVTNVTIVPSAAVRWMWKSSCAMLVPVSQAVGTYR